MHTKSSRLVITEIYPFLDVTKLIKTIPYKNQLRLINANKIGLYCSPKIQTMDYNRIVAVTGLPGLYEAISSKNDGAVVRSLEDQSTKFVSSRIHNLSHLESIEIYTTRDNVSLADVFTAMKDSQTSLPDVKDNKAVKQYFETVYPDLDFERVYTSDMKKMVKWFEVLQKNNVDYTAKSQEEQAVEEPVAETVAVAEESAPKKTKSKAKASAESKEETVAAEEKPKKTARKKKTEE